MRWGGRVGAGEGGVTMQAEVREDAMLCSWPGSGGRDHEVQRIGSLWKQEGAKKHILEPPEETTALLIGQKTLIL